MATLSDNEDLKYVGGNVSGSLRFAAAKSQAAFWTNSPFLSPASLAVRAEALLRPNLTPPPPAPPAVEE